MGIILASKSPRRSELLTMMGVKDFRIMPSDADENISGSTPQEIVCGIAATKARDVRSRCGDKDIIISADTLVYIDNEPLGKPRDAEDAAAMLRKLSGRRHTVCTAVSVISGSREITDCQTSHVQFRQLTEREISAYIATGEPMDKAGAYAVQGRGAVLIDHIEGDFFSIMGLPLCLLNRILTDFGLPLL